MRISDWSSDVCSSDLSLALLSDAGHMLTDVAALTIALMAIRIGARPADGQRTFGYRRFEILAAAFNALMLFAVAIYILVEAINRFRDPEPVQSTGMLIVAVAGLIRSEEHTSELQSLMRNSYAVFCLKKKKH